MINKISNTLRQSETIKDALKKLDKYATKVLVVVDEKGCFLGTLSDGDIRRLLLKGKFLDDPINDDYYQSPIYLNKETYSKEKALDLCKKEMILGVPVIDANNMVFDYFNVLEHHSSESIFTDIQIPEMPVVVMCGGKGTRLKPMSDIFPKPLIPIQGKAMVEHVINYFCDYGVTQFFFTLNYKSELIKAYFKGITRHYDVDFVVEKDFLGTAGSLLILEEELPDQFIISNCDCMVKMNLNEAIESHNQAKADLTIISSIQHHQVPYGILHYTKGGNVTKIEEKPEISLPINTGVYIANKSILNFIQKDVVFHMTDLIDCLIKNGNMVKSFFINEKEFVDFGQWKEYKEAINLLR